MRPIVVEYKMYIPLFGRAREDASNPIPSPPVHSPTSVAQPDDLQNAANVSEEENTPSSARTKTLDPFVRAL